MIFMFILGCSGMTALQNSSSSDSVSAELSIVEADSLDNSNIIEIHNNFDDKINEPTPNDAEEQKGDEENADAVPPPEEEPSVPPKIIDPEGKTLEARFPTPFGYSRIAGKDSGYAEFLRKLPLLPDGSPVLLYNGELKDYQAGHMAVVDIDVGKKDLQQCADAAMRLRTEYLFHSNQHEKMIYHLTNRQELSWPKWKKGYRLKYLGHNKTEYNKTASANASYETYRKWLDVLMMYAGVSSIMKFDSTAIELDEIEPGDAFASTGHLIIIIDVVQNDAGKKMFMLAQSYMPAQQIEILINPYDPSTPWFSLDTVRQAYADGNAFVTPEWEFPPPGPNVYRMK